MSHTASTCPGASRDASPVLLEGETGVGKDLAAQTLHALAFPPSALFLTFDPAAGPPAATTAAAGGGGTLFIEEIGELPAEAPAGLSADDCHRLELALAELAECRRILGLARRADAGFDESTD